MRNRSIAYILGLISPLTIYAQEIDSVGNTIAVEEQSVTAVEVKDDRTFFQKTLQDSAVPLKPIELPFVKELTGNDDSKFTPTLNYGIGMVLTTLYQEVKDDGREGSSNYHFEPGQLKIGFLHTDMQITRKLGASVSWNLHANKITDAFITYKFNPLFNVQLGRFKGAGNRAANETSAYDADFTEFTYMGEAMSTASAGPDLRHYGIDFSGRWKWLKYKFFWHNSDSERNRYWSGANDGPKPGTGNHGLEFKSWDASIGIFPVKNVELGGHMGSINKYGMGYRTNYAYSAYLYYINPNKFKAKFDFGSYRDALFTAGTTPGAHDYTKYDYTNVDKLGASILLGYNITEKFEPVVRYEYFNQGNNTKNIEGYRDLHLLTAGFNYYVNPKNKRMGKISAFYQHRGEYKGKHLPNDWVAIAYQIVLYNNDTKVVH